MSPTVEWFIAATLFVASASLAAYLVVIAAFDLAGLAVGSAFWSAFAVGAFADAVAMQRLMRCKPQPELVEGE
ncbi:MAG: hypothetical protein WKG52_00900 [Variovorax sp.]